MVELRQSALSDTGLDKTAELVEGLQALEVFGLHLEAEFLLHEHHDVDHFQAVDVHVFFQACVVRDLGGIDFHLVDEERLDFIFNFVDFHSFSMIHFLLAPAYQDGMALSQVVVNGLYRKAGLPDDPDEFVGMVHLAVSVGHGREIEAGHRQAERGGLETLAVPEGLHDAQTGLRTQDGGRTAQDALDLRFAEAVEELAHPHDVERLGGRQDGLLVQQVDAVAFDAVGTRLSGGLLLHHADLLRQVGDGHAHVGIMSHALERPPSGIAAHVKQPFRVEREDDLQRFLEGIVGVEVVEVEPGFLDILRQG